MSVAPAPSTSRRRPATSGAGWRRRRGARARRCSRRAAPRPASRRRPGRRARRRGMLGRPRARGAAATRTSRRTSARARRSTSPRASARRACAGDSGTTPQGGGPPSARRAAASAPSSVNPSVRAAARAQRRPATWRQATGRRELGTASAAHATERTACRSRRVRRARQARGRRCGGAARRAPRAARARRDEARRRRRAARARASSDPSSRHVPKRQRAGQTVVVQPARRRGARGDAPALHAAAPSTHGLRAPHAAARSRAWRSRSQARRAGGVQRPAAPAGPPPSGNRGEVDADARPRSWSARAARARPQIHAGIGRPRRHPRRPLAADADVAPAASTHVHSPSSGRRACALHAAAAARTAGRRRAVDAAPRAARAVAAPARWGRRRRGRQARGQSAAQADPSRPERADVGERDSPTGTGIGGFSAGTRAPAREVQGRPVAEGSDARLSGAGERRSRAASQRSDAEAPRPPGAGRPRRSPGRTGGAVVVTHTSVGAAPRDLTRWGRARAPRSRPAPSRLWSGARPGGGARRPGKARVSTGTRPASTPRRRLEHGSASARRARRRRWPRAELRVEDEPLLDRVRAVVLLALEIPAGCP